MALSPKVVTVLKRSARALGAVLVGFLVAWLAGPDVTELVGSDTQALVVAVVTPLLLAADKWLRYGSDPGEV